MVQAFLSFKCMYYVMFGVGEDAPHHILKDLLSGVRCPDTECQWRLAFCLILMVTGEFMSMAIHFKVRT